MSGADEATSGTMTMEQPNWERFYRRLREEDFLPGYEIQTLLGRGSFGVVYKARKCSVGRPCAVKFLKVEDRATSKAVMRELASLEHLAQLDHPNLVGIEDRGEVEGIPYIVMEYGGEETLAARLAGREGLPREEALAVLASICGAVQSLHDHGIIHFDIKPGNIYLRNGRPRLGDYGLARLITESRRTLSFGRGTPLYMAPELLEGKGDERSDIYSLGVLLFECLSGRPPFEGETEWEVMKRHESEEITFPSDFPADLRPLVARAMAKDPGGRFRHAAEMAVALGEPAAAGSFVPPPSRRAGAARPGPAPTPTRARTPCPRPFPGVPGGAGTGDGWRSWPGWACSWPCPGASCPIR